MPVIVEQAPAKINLYLHILGRRADGYHLVESAAVFAQFGDEVEVATAENLSLTIDGEFAEAAGSGDGNLVLRAARLLQQKTGSTQGAAIRLTKHIPVGAGLGGGSADAAATLRALNLLWDVRLSHAELQALAPELGADVAMCIAAQPVLVRGIGEQLTPLLWALPELHAVLVHPRVPLMTMDVYAALRRQPLAGHEETKETATRTLSFAEAMAELNARGNDLEAPAMLVSNTVGEVMNALQTIAPRNACVRMTGSGACCFALYETAAQAQAAAITLQAQKPEWFVTATVLR